eukprot:tig00021123_g18506.t1
MFAACTVLPSRAANPIAAVPSVSSACRLALSRQLPAKSFFGSAAARAAPPAASQQSEPRFFVDAAFEAGQKVRVAKSVVVYMHPEHRNQPFDVKGMEGTISRVYDNEVLTANLPVVVELLPKFKLHLADDEIELVQ